MDAVKTLIEFKIGLGDCTVPLCIGVNVVGRAKLNLEESMVCRNMNSEINKVFCALKLLMLITKDLRIEKIKSILVLGRLPPLFLLSFLNPPQKVTLIFFHYFWYLDINF